MESLPYPRAQAPRAELVPTHIAGVMILEACTYPAACVFAKWLGCFRTRCMVQPMNRRKGASTGYTVFLDKACRFVESSRPATKKTGACSREPRADSSVVWWREYAVFRFFIRLFSDCEKNL